MKTAELRMIPVSELKPAEYNLRKKLKSGDKEYEKIKNSIEEFGFADPLVVNADMTIIGGHQRYNLAVALGYTELPCAVVDVDKVREKALNKITSAWDENRLAELLEDIQNSEFDLGKTGFDPPEIEQFFNAVHDQKVSEDNFNVDEQKSNVHSTKVKSCNIRPLRSACQTQGRRICTSFDRLRGTAYFLRSTGILLHRLH